MLIKKMIRVFECNDDSFIVDNDEEKDASRITQGSDGIAYEVKSSTTAGIDKDFHKYISKFSSPFDKFPSHRDTL